MPFRHTVRIRRWKCNGCDEEARVHSQGRRLGSPLTILASILHGAKSKSVTNANMDNIKHSLCCWACDSRDFGSKLHAFVSSKHSRTKRQNVFQSHTAILRPYKFVFSIWPCRVNSRRGSAGSLVLPGSERTPKQETCNVFRIIRRL